MKKRILLALGFFAVVLVGCAVYIDFVSVDWFATAADAQEASALANRVKDDLKAQNIVVEVYCRPSPPRNTLLIYGNTDASGRDQITAVIRKACEDLKSKRTEIEFFKERLHDSGQETPIDVVEITGNKVP